MSFLARLFSRDGAAVDGPAEGGAHPTPETAASGAVEELSAQLRDARGKARAARQRGRVLQRDGRMSEALRAFTAAGEHQELADRLERERALIRRAG